MGFDLISFNAQKGKSVLGTRRLRPYCSLIEKAPDILLVQEHCSPDPHADTAWWAQRGYLWHFGATRRVSGLGIMGNAIALKASAFDLKEVKIIDVSASRWERRGVVHTRVEHRGASEEEAPLDIYCIHWGLRSLWREKQWAILKDLARESARVLVGGDFNAPPPERQRFAAGMSLVSVAWGPTYPSYAPMRDLDGFLVSQNAEVKEGGVLRLEGGLRDSSDHCPVWARIRL